MGAFTPSCEMQLMKWVQSNLGSNIFSIFNVDEHVAHSYEIQSLRLSA